MWRAVLALVAALGFQAWAQQTQVPQSPRQALIEMLFSRTGAGLEKHLPDATKAALQKGNAPSGFGFAGPGMFGTSKNMQVFETGPVLMASDEARGEKFEIHIERDDLTSDHDEIDLSFHTLKDGVEQGLTSFYPRVSLKMGLEKGVWKLKEVALNLRLPLDDPEFLKGLQEAFKERPGASPDMAAMSSVHMLIFAEKQYKRMHPERGFTCSLTELSSVKFGNGEVPMIDAGLASGTKGDYKFAVTGCGTAPASSFQVTAVPLSPGKRAFCADQSGELRYSADGLAETCLASGQPVSGTSFLSAEPSRSPREP